MRTGKAPSLDDLAFANRNKAYGGYYFRKHYIRTLSVSMVIGVLIMLSMMLIPWVVYLLEPIPLVEGDLMYEVDYMPMSPPPDDDMNKIAGALAPVNPVIEKAPVVTDSVVREEESKPLVQEPEKNPESEADSTPVHQGPSGVGDGTGTDQGVAVTVDVHPKFPGGDEYRLYYLRQNVRYPEAALKNNIQGTVLVVFVVEPDGSISNVEVSKKLGGGCDEEAIRVTRSMPRWEPGKRNGRPVRVLVRMPIVFRIPGR